MAIVALCREHFGIEVVDRPTGHVGADLVEDVGKLQLPFFVGHIAEVRRMDEVFFIDAASRTRDRKNGPRSSGFLPPACGDDRLAGGLLDPAVIIIARPRPRPFLALSVFIDEFEFVLAKMEVSGHARLPARGSGNRPQSDKKCMAFWLEKHLAA
jgi:hypothetical protein